MALRNPARGSLTDELRNRRARGRARQPCRQGDEVVVVNGGRFGERWIKLATAYGVPVHEVRVPWGQAVDPDAVRQALKANPRSAAVCVQACESSTGVAHPVRELAAITAETEACLIVDAVSALGAMPLPMDAWGVDVLVAASQKALMLPPGLGFVTLSEKAWARNKKAKLGKWYFDLGRELKNQVQNQSAYTPAVSLIEGLLESLRLMKEEGLANIFARHHRLAEGTRAGVQALGLELFAKVPADSVTSVLQPASLKPDAVYKGLMQRANITIAGGQDAVKGKIFRVAHLGYYDELDILTVLSAIEIVLRQEGYTSFTPGAGVGAASAILAAGFVDKAAAAKGAS
ncbi:MAG TPA: alanine--glyoxylate aminotransferase family protein [Myxococcota bacterium]